MSELSAQDVAARVVAWHNRHPLARRLRLTDVHSVGHVALPFHDPLAPPPAASAGSLRERAMARARQAPPTDGPAAAAATQRGPLTPAFRDDFIPPLTPAEVGAFGAAHGVERSGEPTGAPVRRVLPVLGSGGFTWRWLCTAELRSGDVRTRILLSPVPGGPVLGRRLWSLPRVGTLAALGGAALVLALGAGLLPGLDTAPAPVAMLPGAAPVTPTPSAAPPLAARPAEPEPTPATQTAMPASSAAPPTPSAAVPIPAAASKPGGVDVAPEPVRTAAAASRPVDVEPQLGRIELPSIGPIADARRRQAAAAAAAAASTAASMPPKTGAVAAVATGSARAAAAAPAAAASAPVFALATRLLRTRTESQDTAEALRALLVVPGSPVQRVDVIRAGDDYRVVAWPYPGQAEAERARAAMQARGHRLELVAF